MAEIQFTNEVVERQRVSSKVSSGNRRRPFADIVEVLERDDPEGVAACGMSSAALRAGDLVRLMRRDAGLSQSELADCIDVSQARISEIEAGVGSQGPTWRVMERIAKACGRRIGLVD